MDIENRVAHLEDDVATIKIDLAVIKSKYATNEDIAKIDAKISDAKSSIII